MATLQAETTKIVRLADRDLWRLWRLVSSGVAAGEALHDLLPAIVREYGALGGSVAAEWYDQQREKAAVRGRFQAIPVDPSDRGAHALIGFAVETAQSDEALKTLILGGVQRRIADHLRLTVTNSAVTDPAAKGWVRVGVGGDCGWCQQYLDGAVRTVEGYDFAAHDHCNCTTAPVFN